MPGNDDWPFIALFVDDSLRRCFKLNIQNRQLYIFARLRYKNIRLKIKKRTKSDAFLKEMGCIVN
ncbi:hypothetical protein GCM10027566_23680 [Arachidicoccus ginsenosidivorans]